MPSKGFVTLDLDLSPRPESSLDNGLLPLEIDVPYSREHKASLDGFVPDLPHLFEQKVYSGRALVAKILIYTAPEVDPARLRVRIEEG